MEYELQVATNFQWQLRNDLRGGVLRGPHFGVADEELVCCI
jgi:hypothetical protein